MREFAAIIVREQNLLQFESFCRSLVETLNRHDVGTEKALAILRTTVSGECARCGQQVSGEEVFALSQPPMPEFASAKIGRMRLGDCARKGCNSYIYRLTFRPQPPLDWDMLITEAERIRREAPAVDVSWIRGLEIWAHSPTVRRVAAGIAILMLLFVLRQLYFGGSIPLIRQPEKFHVQVDPNQATEE